MSHSAQQSPDEVEDYWTPERMRDAKPMDRVAPGMPRPPAGCTEEAKLCPDGSFAGRTGPDCAFAPCPGGGEPGSAPCNEWRAKDAAAAHPAVAEFCANPSWHGCEFSAAAPALDLKAGETPAAWTVKAALIHSYGEDGSPRFMPEGFLFADVSPACAVIRAWGHGGQVYPEKSGSQPE